MGKALLVLSLECVLDLLKQINNNNDKRKIVWKI